jgi:hypothetical protein
MSNDLWEAIAIAQEEPATADCVYLSHLLARELEGRSDVDQLRIGGEAIVQIAEICWRQAQLFRDQWSPSSVQDEAVIEILAAVDPDGLPTLTLEELRQWERQYMSVDLEADEEDYPRKTMAPRSASDSVAGPVKRKQVLKLIQDLAGNDTPSVWAQTIRHWLKQTTEALPVKSGVEPHSDSIAFSTLCQQLPLSGVEIWMGLLLGGFDLSQSGEFYKAEVWIKVR